MKKILLNYYLLPSKNINIIIIINFLEKLVDLSVFINMTYYNHNYKNKFITIMM